MRVEIGQIPLRLVDGERQRLAEVVSFSQRIGHVTRSYAAASARNRTTSAVVAPRSWS